MTPAREAKEQENLRPGSVHVYRPRNAVALGVGLWAKNDDTGQIHIHVTGGKRFHTTLTNAKGSQRYHRTLFRNLRRVLIENHAWPYGREGAETERK